MLGSSTAVKAKTHRRAEGEIAQVSNTDSSGFVHLDEIVVHRAGSCQTVIAVGGQQELSWRIVAVRGLLELVDLFVQELGDDSVEAFMARLQDPGYVLKREAERALQAVHS